MPDAGPIGVVPETSGHVASGPNGRFPSGGWPVGWGSSQKAGANLNGRTGSGAETLENGPGPKTGALE